MTGVRDASSDGATPPDEARSGAVLLDMDGTLIDTEPLWFEATRRALARLGHELPAAAAADVLGLDFDAVLERLRTAYGIDVDRAALRDALAAAIGPALAHARARPGAAELVAHVVRSGTHYALVSNSPHAVITATLSPHAWAAVLERRFSVEDVERGKPAPDVYLHAARELGLDPRVCLAVEDSVTGATSAVAAGIRCVAVAFDPADRAALEGVTPHVVASLAEVPTRLDLLTTDVRST